MEQAKDTTGHGDGECLHLGVGGPRQRVEAQLRPVQLLEDGLWPLGGRNLLRGGQLEHPRRLP